MNKQISHFDEYCWIDFYKDSKQIFQGVDELRNFCITNFPRVAALILYQSSYFLKKDTQEDLHNRIPKLPMIFNVQETVIKRGKLAEQIIPMSLHDMLDSCKKEIPVFANETFKPMNYLLKKDEFNTWVGFKAERSKPSEGKMGGDRYSSSLPRALRSVGAEYL